MKPFKIKMLAVLALVGVVWGCGNGAEPLDDAFDAVDLGEVEDVVDVPDSSPDVPPDVPDVPPDATPDVPLEVPACEEWAGAPGSLAAKAAFLDARVREKLLDDGLIRTVREDGDGNVLSREHLPSTGLWTAMYLASQSYRWAVTGAEEALETHGLLSTGYTT